MGRKAAEVTVNQLRKNPSRVFRRVADGEPLVIVAGRTRIPVAWLMPYLHREENREERPLEEAGSSPDEKGRR